MTHHLTEWGALSIHCLFPLLLYHSNSNCLLLMISSSLQAMDVPRYWLCWTLALGLPPMDWPFFILCSTCFPGVNLPCYAEETHFITYLSMQAEGIVQSSQTSGLSSSPQMCFLLIRTQLRMSKCVRPVLISCCCQGGYHIVSESYF